MKILLKDMTIQVLDRIRHFAEEQPCLTNQKRSDPFDWESSNFKPMVIVHSVRLQNGMPYPPNPGQFVMMFEIEVEIDESDSGSVTAVKEIIEIVYEDHGIDFSSELEGEE